MSGKLTCKQILEALSEYIDEELDPSVCDEIDKHMEGCTNCINFVTTLRKTVTLYNTAGKEVQIPESVSVDLHSFLKANCEQSNGD